MKVKELIRLLALRDPEAEVVVPHDEEWNWLEPIGCATRHKVVHNVNGHPDSNNEPMKVVILLPWNGE